MTVRDDVLKELSTGPKTFAYLERKCTRPNLPPGHVLRTVMELVNAREIVAREWVVDRGKFTPVYESRRRAP